MLKLIGICVTVLLVSMSAVQAQNCHLGAQAGSSIASASISAPSIPATLDGLGARSRTPDFGLHAGCDVKVAGPITLGIWGQHIWKDTAFSAGIGPFSFSSSLGNAYSFGGRAGYVLPNGSMPYVLAGYTVSDLNYSMPLTGVPSSLRGWTGGAGFETPLGNGFSLALETTCTRFSEADLIPSLATIRADQISAMARINFNIGAK